MPRLIKARTRTPVFLPKLFFQRSLDEGHEDDATKVLIDDLKEILQLKATIDQIKEEAQDPHLDAETKLDKLKELQDALERLQNLRADVIKTEGMGETSEQTKDTGLGRLSFLTASLRRQSLMLLSCCCSCSSWTVKLEKVFKYSDI